MEPVMRLLGRYNLQRNRTVNQREEYPTGMSKHAPLLYSLYFLLLNNSLASFWDIKHFFSTYLSLSPSLWSDLYNSPSKLLLT